MKMQQPTQLLLSVTTLFLAALLVYGVAMETAQGSETGFLTGSSESGLNRICYYSAPSGTFAITIGTARICPVTYQR